MWSAGAAAQPAPAHGCKQQKAFILQEGRTAPRCIQSAFVVDKLGFGTAERAARITAVVSRLTSW